MDKAASLQVREERKDLRIDLEKGVSDLNLELLISKATSSIPMHKDL